MLLSEANISLKSNIWILMLKVVNLPLMWNRNVLTADPPSNVHKWLLFKSSALVSSEGCAFIRIVSRSEMSVFWCRSSESSILLSFDLIVAFKVVSGILQMRRSPDLKRLQAWFWENQCLLHASMLTVKLGCCKADKLCLFLNYLLANKFWQIIYWSFPSLLKMKSKFSPLNPWAFKINTYFWLFWFSV